jgi:hypothetical protein
MAIQEVLERKETPGGIEVRAGSDASLIATMISAGSVLCSATRRIEPYIPSLDAIALG